jgi:hypothetical protein
MDRDAIAEIGIDDKGRPYMTPSTRAFPYLYREAMEVHWDDQENYLHAPLPARAQLAQPIWWFERILAAAREQDCELYIDQHTKWHNVPSQLRSEILSNTRAVHA